jgi:uncharacterized protein YciI
MKMAKYVVIYEDWREDTVTPDMMEGLTKGHVDYLKDLHAQGTLFMCGPLKDIDEKGLLIFEANSREEVENCVQKDPFVIHKCCSYRICDWIVADDSNNWLMDG